MTRLALVLVFALSFALALAVSLPLGVVLAWSHADDSGLSAANVVGSVWNGHLAKARLRGIPLGDVEARLDPFALVTGMRRIALKSPRGNAIVVQGRVQGLDQADLTLNFADVGLALPVQGTVRLEQATLLFDGETCSRASGRISTDIFRAHWNGPDLSGDLLCDGNAATAHLSGRNADVEIAMALRIDADGRYRLESHVESPAPALQTALFLAGFRESPDGMVRYDEGKLGT